MISMGVATQVLVALVAWGGEEPRWDEIRTTLRAAVEDKSVLGVSMLVMHRGQVAFREAFGGLKVGQQIQVASCSKPITASLILRLEDQGKLSLDDPVSKYIPEFANVALEGGTKPEGPIRIRHVLTNTSGYPGDFTGAASVPPLFATSLASAVRDMAKTPLAAEPGREFRYCSLGFNVAARVAEVAGGKPFEEQIRAAIFEPLGMTRTEYARLGGLDLARPPGEGRFVMAGGAMLSTLDDLGRFYEMLRNRGTLDGKRILSERAVESMRTPRIPLSPNLVGSMGDAYGVALFLDRKDATGRYQTVSHAGILGTVPWLDYDREVVGVIFTQGAFDKVFRVAFRVQDQVQALYAPEGRPGGIPPSR